MRNRYENNPRKQGSTVMRRPKRKKNKQKRNDGRGTCLSPPPKSAIEVCAVCHWADKRVECIYGGLIETNSALIIEAIW